MDKLNVEKLKFELTRAEADLMIEGLSELPLKRSFALVTNLQNQFQVQTAKVAEAEKTESDKETSSEESTLEKK